MCTMLLLPLCLLAVISWFAHAEGALSGDAFTLTEPMNRCLKEGKVHWPKKDTCNELPGLVCGKRQWLVLDLEKINQTNAMEPVCKPMPCPMQPLHVYWPASNTCVSLNEATNLCPKGNELKEDVYGEGTCVCKKPPSAVLLPLSATIGPSECLPLYDRRPCPEGQILLARRMDNQGHIAQCQPDPCAKMYTSDAAGTLALDPITKICYPLGSLGPCSQTEGELFQVSELSYLPECSIGLGLMVFSVRKHCLTYPNGTCKESFQIESEAKDAMLTEVSRAMSRQKHKRKRASTGKSG